MPENLASKIEVCDEWNRLSGWVVDRENVNKFKGNLDHYLRDTMGFK